MKNAMDINGIGAVNFVRSLRARYIRITISHEQTVTVIIPRYGTVEEAKRFLLSRLDWVHKQLQNIKQFAPIERKDDLNIDLDKAQDDIDKRLLFFSRQYNFSFNRITFRCQKTKWGSCSAKNNINLNINIAFLPAHLQDYIILHELCHLRHRNHSKSFWLELGKYTGGKARKLSKELRKYKMRIF